MSTIDLASNRSKGQNAYICPVIRYSGRKELDRSRFPKPKPGQEDAAYRGKFFQGEVIISNLPNSWYWYSEAVFQGRKMSSGLIEIKGGEIVSSLETIAELLVATADEFFPSLKPLIGTPKQVALAEKIRAEHILSLWEDGYEDQGSGSLPCESEWWIQEAKDNRGLVKKRFLLIKEGVLVE